MMKLWEKKSGRIGSSEIHTQFGEHYDVIVVGLGTAGSFAAMQAARKGLRVLAIERLNGMGGTGTLGGVAGYYYGTRGGIYEQIDEQVTKYQKQDDFLPFKGMHSELKSWVLDTEVASAGAEVHYLSYVIGVYMQDRTVTGLRWVSPAGIHQSSARIVIDCSEMPKYVRWPVVPSNWAGLSMASRSHSRTWYSNYMRTNVWAIFIRIPVISILRIRRMSPERSSNPTGCLHI